ncbi:ABC transporter permease [Evansella halocellulosilytica]|uniref:ABC transporter permease n=1 Tax=Evansella halocellulosilytica TaxID=2011013 RepID=UPI0015CE1B62|nr:ABC transporter permease [Evansella halocellulosilytica]
MKKLVSVELIKIQWLLIIVLISFDLLVNISLGISDLDMLTEYYEPVWSNYFMYVLNLHAMFLYPLFSGVIAALICSYEHKSGGWKQLFTLPYSRTKMYVAKFIVLISILALIQLFFFGTAVTAGGIVGVEGTISWSFVFQSALFGWISIFPLAAIQLWFSTKFKNFGIAFSINLIFVLPNIIFSGIHSMYGMWFPFILPFYAMMPQGTPFAPRVDEISLYLLIAISFFLFLFLGNRSFKKREFS